MTTALGKPTLGRLQSMQYAENLESKIISYGFLETKGFGIAYRVVADIGGGPHVFDVETANNIFVVRDQGCKAKRSTGDVLMVVLSQGEMKTSVDVQEDSLMYFHQRLGHLHYDNVIRIAADPASA